MALSDTAVRSAKPTDKAYKISDEKGLFLLVHPNGSKYWRQKYRFDGKEKTLAQGVYPDVSLKEARERRDEARKQLASGIDPGQHRKASKATRENVLPMYYAPLATMYWPNWLKDQSVWKWTAYILSS